MGGLKKVSHFRLLYGFQSCSGCKHLQEIKLQVLSARHRLRPNKAECKFFTYFSLFCKKFAHLDILLEKTNIYNHKSRKIRCFVQIHWKRSSLSFQI